jgi:hypothetical protein
MKLTKCPVPTLDELTSALEPDTDASIIAEAAEEGIDLTSSKLSKKKKAKKSDIAR